MSAQRSRVWPAVVGAILDLSHGEIEAEFRPFCKMARWQEVGKREFFVVQ